MCYYYLDERNVYTRRNDAETSETSAKAQVEISQLGMKLGKAFSDSVFTERHRVSRELDEESRQWWLGMGRVLMFITLFGVAFFILVWRLFDLTVIRGHEFRTLADGNRTRELIRHAPRGMLLDRTGKPLVTNIPYFRLIRPCSGQSAGEDCVVPLTQEEGEKLSSKGLPAGSFLEVDYQRRYLYPEALAHIIGYTGEIGENELNDEYYKLRQYRAGDRVGRSGAEAVFEDRLRGRDGKELVEVDATGAIVRTLGRDKESPGVDITLSLDAELSRVAAQSFPRGEKGAVVVTKPSTGEILALYSSPSYDVNAFSLGLSAREYNALLGDPEQPLFDRAIGGVYPPGSTFKIVTALAALEEGAIGGDTTVEDTGVLTIGPFRFPNWYFIQYGKTEGTVDVVKALKRSNDIFFYKAGEALGITKLVSWAHKIGLGRPQGIEVGGEAGGLMPDPAWKKERFNTPQDREQRNDEWYVGDTYHVAIGQGYLLTTPLQVNVWTNIIANGGKLCRPTITKQSQGVCRDLRVSPQTLELITEGMRQACAPGGTGWPLFNFAVNKNEFGEASSSAAAKIPVSLACKTGTAEYGDPKNRTHAWFTVFAPLRDAEESMLTGEPEISITVLVEGAGEGSSVAAPVAKKILEAWLSR